MLQKIQKTLKTYAQNALDRRLKHARLMIKTLHMDALNTPDRVLEMLEMLQTDAQNATDGHLICSRQTLETFLMVT